VSQPIVRRAALRMSAVSESKAKGEDLLGRSRQPGARRRDPAPRANPLSGEYSLRHGVRDDTGFRLPADRATLATILRERGWPPGVLVGAFPLDSRFGLHQSLFNLGTTQRGAGREAEARESLQACLHLAPVALDGRDMARARVRLAEARGGSG